MGLVIGCAFQGAGHGHHCLANEMAHFLDTHLFGPQIHVNGIAIFFIPHGQGHRFCHFVAYITVFGRPLDLGRNFVLVSGDVNLNLGGGHVG